MSRTLEAVIDDLPFGRFHWRLLGLVAVIMLLDGFDLQVAAFAAPAILKAWNLSPAAFAPVAAAALVGVAIGTAVGGALGDRLGRRPLLLAGVAWFGLGALATGFAHEIVDLTALRFLTGLGLGAVIPNAAALLAESTPQRYRSHAVMLVIVGPPLGGMVGAALAAWIIPTFGWRACLWLGAALPLLHLLLMWKGLWESPYHLQRRAVSTGLLAEWMRAAGGAVAEVTSNSEATAASGGLFALGLRRSTIGLFLAFLGSMLVLYGYLSWIPVILTSAGVAPATAIRASLIFNLCGVIASVLAAQAIRTLGSLPALLGLAVGGLAATGLCAGLISAHSLNIAAVWGGLGLAGGAVFALQVGLYGLATDVYPAGIRATGVGMAATIGRVGAIAGAFGGGLLIATDQRLYFAALACGLVCALAGVGIANRHTPARRTSAKAFDGRAR